MTRLSDTDYSQSGLAIRQAFAQARKEYGQPGPPMTEAISIRWGDRDIVVGDIMPAPARGRVRVQLISRASGLRQGADVDVSPGRILVPGAEPVSLLRTWFDDDLPGTVEYDFRTERGLLRTCNVYEMRRGPQVVAERWTGNAGMWVEHLGPGDRIYHCSHGMSTPPTFTDLVYRLTVAGS